MASKAQTLPEHSRVKQLRFLLAIMTLLAVVEGVRSAGYFAVGDHWKSLTYAVIKLAIVLYAAVAVWKKTAPEPGRSESESLLTLKIAGAAMLISFLSDQAFLQNRW